MIAVFPFRHSRKCWKTMEQFIICHSQTSKVLDLHILCIGTHGQTLEKSIKTWKCIGEMHHSQNQRQIHNGQTNDRSHGRTPIYNQSTALISSTVITYRMKQKETVLNSTLWKYFNTIWAFDGWQLVAVMCWMIKKNVFVYLHRIPLMQRENRTKKWTEGIMTTSWWFLA